MIGKSNKMRRRLSIVALAASIAAVAIPAASAGDKYWGGGRYYGPGSTTVEKHGPYGGYWIERIRVLGPGLNTVEKRGPYGAYWVRKNAQSKNTHVDSSSVVDRQLGSPDPRGTVQKSQSFSASVVDRQLGSLDPRDSAILVLNVPCMGEVLLHDVGQAQYTPTHDPASQPPSVSQTLKAARGSVRLPRADDLMFYEILQSAALEHGAAGFGNQTLNSLQILTSQDILQSAAQEHGASGFGN
jgi:hypothetical protein